MPVFVPLPDAAGPNYPYFELEDGDECRSRVLAWYDQVQAYHERDSRLNQSFRDVLDRQLKYGFELVNNNDLWEWAAEGTLDLGDSLDHPDAEHWTEKFAEHFGSYTGDDESDAPLDQIYLVRPIRDAKTLSQAMYYLYQFRYFRGLEDEYHWGRMRQLLSYSMIDESEYEMCSEPTKQQAEILTSEINWK